MSGDSVADAKRAIREHARAARSALDPASRQAASEALAARLCSLRRLSSARLVLAYGATPEEIDPAAAVACLRSNGALIAYPRIERPGVLGVYLIDEDTELVPGPYGLVEPTAGAHRAELAQIDAVIVPGVAFDAHGRRLGYGGGYYDRLLPLLRADCVLIGVGYDQQVVDSIPAENHDVRLSAVVTPTRVLGDLQG